MFEETAYCEMCWTNSAHAHLRDMPICGQCIEEFDVARRLEYIDEQPYETLEGRRLTNAEELESGELPRFNPRNSEELSFARHASLVGAV
ncbi:hypothetical protein RCH21_003260 [Arthrobacter sp. PL16]|nr:hypothetical protein [Arthrobacter sp. PL16]